jgi:hypothetical protein
MKILTVLLALFFVLTSCVSSYKTELARLTVDSKPLNRKIIDRYPDYGDGRKDGCIILSEMHLYLNTKTKGKLLGRVTNVSDNMGLVNASLTITDKLGKNYMLVSDSKGNFEIGFEEQLASVKAQYVGFRTLLANF